MNVILFYLSLILKFQNLNYGCRESSAFANASFFVIGSAEF